MIKRENSLKNRERERIVNILNRQYTSELDEYIPTE